MSQVDSSLLVTRPYWRDDEAFIYATWLKGLYGGNSWFALIPQSIFFPAYHAVLDRIMGHPDTRIRVIALADDPDVILSYVVFDEPRIHWIYTRGAWRGLGLARDLVRELNITQCTHLTHKGQALKPEKWEFNPFFF